MGTSAPASVPARRQFGPAALPTALLLAAGCAARQYPLPMTAAQLAREESPALAAYLAQPDAGAGVCELGAGGPHAVVIDPAARRALDEAFRAARDLASGRDLDADAGVARARL